MKKEKSHLSSVGSIELSVRRKRLLGSLSLFNILFTSSSISQDCVDELSELIPHRNRLKYARNEYLKYLSLEISAMQLVSGEEQLLMLDNCVAMRAIISKILECTKNGSIEEFSELLLTFVPTR